ncbi:uncharacterized protein LOC108704851 isoform X2 [Xenopus laevis]|uniref:Uncharacterized protein LOC108704851 isoform X2 n=1 Tax=Xenopus laevis TaxID=8355 RepID=A0A8J0U680_XENLA|nr:uncharacterized protein LOC108704851 isoform X2 [Xenopus laevis]
MTHTDTHRHTMTLGSPALTLLLRLLQGSLTLWASKGVTEEISAELGATVLIPHNVTCNLGLHMAFDLERTGHNSGVIGSYEDHLLADDEYEERLEFSKESCTFILRNVTETDSGNYTYVQLISSDGRNKDTIKINLVLTITAPETPTSVPGHSVGPTAHGDPQSSGIWGRFVALCLSAVSLGHFLGNLVSWMDAKTLESQCCCLCPSSGISGAISRSQRSLHVALGYTGYLFLICHMVSITLWLLYGSNSVMDWLLLAPVALNVVICITSFFSGEKTSQCLGAECPVWGILQKIEGLVGAHKYISKFLMLGYSISLLVLYGIRCYLLDPAPPVTAAEGETHPEMEKLNHLETKQGGPVEIVEVLSPPRCHSFVPPDM